VVLIDAKSLDWEQQISHPAKFWSWTRHVNATDNQAAASIHDSCDGNGSAQVLLKDKAVEEIHKLQSSHQ